MGTGPPDWSSAQTSARSSAAGASNADFVRAYDHLVDERPDVGGPKHMIAVAEHVVHALTKLGDHLLGF
jgi:hypothetical protein